jgi:hypothetical protein
VQHAGAAGTEARRAGRLDADDPHALVVEEAAEQPDRVRAAPDARHHGVGKPPLGGKDLLARLATDHGLELPDELRIGVRPHARADHVVGGLDVGDPVADRLARGLFQRPRPELDGEHLGAEQVHALDVRLLALHVLGAHEDHALEAEARAHGRGRDAVLAGSRLRDDALLAQPAGHEGLPEGIVDLVRAGVAQVFALEVDALRLREPLCVV